jgi:hypothetical protein
VTVALDPQLYCAVFSAMRQSLTAARLELMIEKSGLALL